MTDTARHTPGSPEAGPGDRAPALVTATHQLEGTEALDGAVHALEPVAAALVSDPARRNLLHGRALGHALHPLLTDLPLGAWISATLLDLLGGRQARPAAQRLVGLGVLAAVPTSMTGLAEWAVADRVSKRVGVVHAAANTVSLALYGASWLARRRGHHARGVLLGLSGSVGSAVGGYLGAHLSLARKVATSDPVFSPAPAAAPARAAAEA